MVVLGVAQGRSGGGQRGRGQDGEHLVEDMLLETSPTQALAAPLTAIELLGPGADIARAVALGPGVAGLHHPAALAAPDPSLQQRCPLPDGAGAHAARGPPVLSQQRGVGLIGLPADEPGVMLGDQDRPLFAGHRDGPHDQLPVGV